MGFPDALGVIACPCVLSGERAVLFVSHAGGDWQMFCHWRNHDFEDAQTLSQLRTVHVSHLVALDPTLEAVADLAVDLGAERSEVGGEWTRFIDRDD